MDDQQTEAIECPVVVKKLPDLYSMQQSSPPVPQKPSLPSNWQSVLRNRPELPNSGLGISSFVIGASITALDLFILLFLLMSMGASRAHSIHSRLLGSIMSMVCFNFVALPICIVGGILGIVAWNTQPAANHYPYTFWGIGLNGIVVIGMLAMIFLGLVFENRY